ncbi:MAG: RNA methyltransferase [Actinomycetota bacterium]|nr:RNA methyltransferase [Actinomycetota bacterium]
MTIGLTARTARGLEWVSADEIASRLAPVQVTLAPREVRFTVAHLDPAVTALRTVDDVFVRVGALRGIGGDRRTPALLAAAAVRLDLASAVSHIRARRHVATHPAIDVVVSIEGDRRFNRYDLEDALGEALSPVVDGTYGPRRNGSPPPSDLTVRVVVAGERAEVMVRIAALPLHRRPWKLATEPGTLHPPAAASLLRLSGLRRTVVDPFCGDGTIPIEAAMGGLRAEGSDLAGRRLANAQANAVRAGVAVGWARADAAQGPWRPGGDAAWVTNPPWNRTVQARGGVQDSLAPAWGEARRLLGPSGTLSVIVDADIDVDADLRAAGWRPAAAQQARMAGRVCRLVIAVPTDGPDRDPLSPTLRKWRRQAQADGLVTDTGF